VDYDIAVIGGGLVGSSIACGLSKTGHGVDVALLGSDYLVVCVDPRPNDLPGLVNDDVNDSRRTP